LPFAPGSLVVWNAIAAKSPLQLLQRILTGFQMAMTLPKVPRKKKFFFFFNLATFGNSPPVVYTPSSNLL